MPVPIGRSPVRVAGRGAVTLGQNQATVALANVLRDQTAPNTLAGLRVTVASRARPRLPLNLLVAILAAIVALVVLVAGRAS